MGVEGRFGSIQPGKIADLVVLEGDPLQDFHLIGKPVQALIYGWEPGDQPLRAGNDPPQYGDSDSLTYIQPLHLTGIETPPATRESLLTK